MKNLIPQNHWFMHESALIGWLAFGFMVLLFFSVVVWYYKKEADRAKKELQTERNHYSERSSLLYPNRRYSLLNKYNRLSSEDEETCDELDGEGTLSGAGVSDSLRKILTTKVLDRRYPIFVGSSSANAPPVRADFISQLKTHKHNMDVSTMSTGSDSTQVSRPLSYREMRKHAVRTPKVRTISYAV